MRDSQYIDQPDEFDVFFQRPCVNYCGHLVAAPDYYLGLGEHVHDCTEVSICIKGKGTQVIGKREYPFCSGCMVLLNPGTRHYDIPDRDDPPEFLFMGIDHYVFSSLPRNTVRSEEQSPILILGNGRDDIETHFLNLLREVSQRGRYYKSMSSMLAGCILMLAMRERGMPVTKPAVVHSHRVKKFIDDNYTSPLNLTAISETLYISKSYISHIFKSDMGVSPIEYLINKRMVLAKDLLKNTARPVVDIAAEIGYEDPEYFTQLFRRVEGMSPTAYRAQSRGKV